MSIFKVMLINSTFANSAFSNFRRSIIRRSVIRRSLGVSSPLPHLPETYLPPSSAPLKEGAVRDRVDNGGDGSASGGSRYYYNTTCLTATPSAAGRGLRLVTTRLLEIIKECVDSSVWPSMLSDVRGGVENLSFIHKLPPAAPVEPLPTHHHTSLDDDRLMRGNERATGERREAWKERSCTLPPATPQLLRMMKLQRP
jgi:hypothetical protein